MTPYDFWLVNEFNNDPYELVKCECLMPTGHVIDLTVPHAFTFQEIKEVSVCFKFKRTIFRKQNKTKNENRGATFSFSKAFSFRFCYLSDFDVVFVCKNTVDYSMDRNCGIRRKGG